MVTRIPCIVHTDPSWHSAAGISSCATETSSCAPRAQNNVRNAAVTKETTWIDALEPVDSARPPQTPLPRLASKQCLCSAWRDEVFGGMGPVTNVPCCALYHPHWVVGRWFPCFIYEVCVCVCVCRVHGECSCMCIWCACMITVVPKVCALCMAGLHCMVACCVHNWCI